VQPPGLTHNAADTESFTLEPSLIIFRKISCIRVSQSFVIERMDLILPFTRSSNPVTPVFTDNRDPVTGEFDWSHSFCRYRSAPLSPSLGMSNGSSREENHQ
jgi:hypothetical protein